jgi:CheY-like chemotaxis protein
MARYHILIVDDQHDIRSLLRSSLETLKLDLEIVDVPSAEEALLVLGKEQIDLMVADVRLPGMSGLELRERAGRRMPTTQLILITGVADEKVQRQVAQAGVAAYFYKPIEIERFLEAVRSCLGTSGARKSPKSAEAREAISEVVQPIMANPLAELCAQQAVLGALVLSSQGEILYECGSISSQNERQEIERMILSLLEQDRQRSGTIVGAVFPYHHLFSGQARDLWVTCLGANLALAAALPAGEAAHMASGMLREVERLRARLTPAKLSGVNLQVAATPAQVIQPADEVDSSLIALLDQATGPQLHADEVDAYWDELAREDHFPEQTPKGVLSYEEALRLGLATDENNG